MTLADLLQTAASWLADQLHDNAAVTVTYRRGSDSVSLSATLGSQLFRTSDRQGNTKVERTDRDFLFRAADLILSGSVVTPLRGDFIDLVTGTLTERFEVMAPGSEAHYRYSDPYKKRVRVHTKFKGIQPVQIVDVDSVDVVDVGGELVASV